MHDSLSQVRNRCIATSQNATKVPGSRRVLFQQCAKPPTPVMEASREASANHAQPTTPVHEWTVKPCEAVHFVSVLRAVVQSVR